MKKILLSCMMMGLLLVVASCSSDDGDENIPPVLTDEDVLESGWTYFGAGDLASAIDQFDELITRNALLADAYTGLGWTYARGNALTDAENAFTAGDLADPAGDLVDDLNAGWAFVKSASDDHDACVTLAGSVSETWFFAHDTAFDFQDLIVLRASSYYFLGNFSQSLTEVQRIDAAFTADIATPEGRAALAAKIEDLLGA